MKVVNAVKFIFPGISENERTARAVVSAFLVQLDPTVEELADIRTAVSEAVTNAIIHGYPDEVRTVIVRARLTDQLLELWVITAAALRTSHRRCSLCLPRLRKKNVPDWALRLWKASWTSCKSRVHRKREQL